MKARFAKWGNSLALRIPASFAQAIAVREGATADLAIEDGCLVVRPLAEPHYDLADLVAGIEDSNRHGEVGTHAAVGNEFS